MRVIIGLYGKQGRGKSTIAKMLSNMLPNFIVNPLALPVKQEYAELAGITLETVESRKKQDPTIREGLQSLGRGKRAKNPRIWIDKCLAYQGSFIVDDIRYENEIEAFREAADVFYLIRVESPRELVLEQERINLSHEDHITETQLDDHDSEDFVINNSFDLEVLEGQATWAAYDILTHMMLCMHGTQQALVSNLLGVEDVQEDEED